MKYICLLLLICLGFNGNIFHAAESWHWKIGDEKKSNADTSFWVVGWFFVCLYVCLVCFLIIYYFSGQITYHIFPTSIRYYN